MSLFPEFSFPPTRKFLYHKEEMTPTFKDNRFGLLLKPDPGEWDNFLAKNLSGSFLQSWAWGEFQKNLGRQVFRLQIKDRNRTIWAQALVIEMILPLKQKLLYSPLPLLFNPKAKVLEQQEIWRLILQEIKKINQSHLLFRIDPLEERTPFFAQAYKNLGFLPSKKHLQPRDSLILDLALSENELLSAMKPKTRYNIRLAKKKGIEIEEARTDEEINTFLRLLEETARREGFKPHPPSYYKKQLELFLPQGLEKLFLAYFHREPLSAILVSFFGQRATYLHGGSSRKHKELMAPYLLQWEAIREAKKLNCRLYDLWGVAPGRDEKHPWAGITRFKLGFGGKVVSYLPAQELPLQPFRYKIYKLLRG